MMIGYNPFDPAVMADPYPYFAQLRAEAPVHYVEAAQIHAISRYEDVIAALKNPGVFSSRSLFSFFLDELNPVPEASPIIALDAPEHTRQRALIMKVLTPRVVGNLEGFVRGVVRGLLDRAAEKDEIEFVSEFAHPIPAYVIGELLGIETERREQLVQWANDVTQVSTRVFAEDELGRIRGSIAELRAYFEDAIAKRRKEPRDDLMSLLIHAEENGERFTDHELLATFFVLLAAGNETTTMLMSNMLIALLRNEEQFERVRADRSLIPAAVEEALRFDAPILGLTRYVTRPTAVSDVELSEGAIVMLLYASANRDERVYEAPDAFNIFRAGERPHLAFSHGPHFCAGNALARLEATIAMEMLLDRFSSITLAREPERTVLPFTRGAKSIHLEFELARQAKPVGSPA